MPVDSYDDDDDGKGAPQGASRRFDEFDCPGCSANNPVGEPFGDGDEVLCNYCGTEFRAKVSEEGKLKLREI